MLKAAEIVNPEPQEEDAARAHVYGFLAHLLTAPPTADTLAAVSALRGDDSALGVAIGALAQVAAGLSTEAAETEFSALFVGLTAGELQPYASYYRTGFLFEKPLAELRHDMNRLGIARADGVSEPEDHIAALCEMMQGLIAGRFGAPADVATQRAFFAAHLAPWAAQFFGDLEAAASADFYARVGGLGRTFIAIEQEAFAIAG